MAIRRGTDKVLIVVLAWLMLEHFFEHYGCKSATEIVEWVIGIIKK
jgi:hypothetical protein